MKKFSVILLIFFLNTCCGFQGYKYSSKAEIRKNIFQRISLFDEFLVKGIANLEIDQFEFKANFLGRKKGDKFKIDFLSGGIFGLSPKPKLQIFNSDSLQIYLPDRSEIYCFSGNFLNLKQNFRRLLYDSSIKINNDKNITLEINEKSNLIFSSDYDLLSIKSNDLTVFFSAYKNYFPNEVTIKYFDKRVALFKIDSWDLSEQKNDLFYLKIPEETKKITDISKIKKFFKRVSQ